MKRSGRIIISENEGTDENSWNLNFFRTESGDLCLFLYIAEELGIPISRGWLPLVDYVELVSPIREDRFRMVNRTISMGQVQVNDDEMYELVRERIREDFVVAYPTGCRNRCASGLDPDWGTPRRHTRSRCSGILND